MHISSNFDSGNIQVLGIDGDTARLAIRPDAGDEHMQWFHFRLSGVASRAVTLRIENAGKASYPSAWPGYQARASSDRQEWLQVPTSYADGVLTIQLQPEANVVWVAYFAPYSQERHHNLLGNAQACGARMETLGQTLDGRDLDMLVLGSGPRKLWVIARQHPGESMAEWWMEGFLGRLLDGQEEEDGDPQVTELLTNATLYVVPNMNPDGSARGHLRVNASGANLNREWENPTMERSPEVKLVRDAMDRLGCDFCLDVHGDEELPYNFIAAAEGIAGWTPRLETLTQDFCNAYEQADPAFQQEHGYPKDAPGKANMTMCTSQVAQRFDCLAMTLEMPFKDDNNHPDAELGWSPERAMELGANVVSPMVSVLDALR